MKCRQIEIMNKLGLHARASAKFVKMATGFKDDITLSHNGQTVNGKSIMGIMMLAASKGTVLELCADGETADIAVTTLTAMVDDLFGEDE